MGGELCLCVWGLLMTFFIVFSRTNLNEFTCVFACVIRKSYKYTYGTNNALSFVFMFCRYIATFFACLCEMRAINMLSGCCCLKDGYFSLLLLWVLCVLKRPFLHYFRQYTKYMSARVCDCVFNLRMLLASSHYYCFIFFFFFLDYHEQNNIFLLWHFYSF